LLPCILERTSVVPYFLQMPECDSPFLSSNRCVMNWSHTHLRSVFGSLLRTSHKILRSSPPPSFPPIQSLAFLAWVLSFFFILSPSADDPFSIAAGSVRGPPPLSAAPTPYPLLLSSLWPFAGFLSFDFSLLVSAFLAHTAFLRRVDRLGPLSTSCPPPAASVLRIQSFPPPLRGDFSSIFFWLQAALSV